MKRRDLDRILHQDGWTMEHGKKHDIATNPKKPGVSISIPRHTEIKEPTAKKILKQAGL